MTEHAEKVHYVKLHWAIRLRLRLLRAYPCRWNGWVRDFTARLER